MRALIPALLLLQPALHAEEDLQLPDKKPRATSLLPSGSKLHGVMLPRYDENQRLSAVLKADVMTLVSDQVIAGDQVTIAFYNPDRSPRARIEMNHAALDQVTGLLDAGGSVAVRSGRIEADGTGLIYQTEKAEGFLTGPAETRILPLPETTMTKPHPYPDTAVALAGAALLTIAAAEPPAPLTELEKAALVADAAPAAPAHAEAVRATRSSLRADLTAAAEATAAAAAFLDEAGFADDASTAPALPPAAPLDIEPGPEDTLISCDGGIYFDADAGILVYLKNVRVRDPRFDLTGANELKIFLEKKPDPPADKDGRSDQPDKDDKAVEKPAAPAIGANFGDVERVVATGAVRILQKQPEPGKEPVEASGAIFTYHPKTGEIVITGGYPWVKQGASFMRAKEPNLILRIYKSGAFDTEGNWDMGGRLNQNP